MSLLKRVLARTSGPSCPSAVDRLVPFAEGDLDAIDRELVASHLARCPACREVLEGVLRKTSRRPGLADAWRRLVLRPRFALEAAYVGAVVLLVIVTVADVPARTVPDLMRTVISDLKEKP